MKTQRIIRLAALMLALLMLTGTFTSCNLGRGGDTTAPATSGSPDESATLAPEPPLTDPEAIRSAMPGTWKVTTNIGSEASDNIKKELKSLGIQVVTKKPQIPFTFYLDLSADGYITIFTDDSENTDVGTAIASIMVDGLNRGGQLAQVLANNEMTEAELTDALAEEYGYPLSSESVNEQNCYAIAPDGKMIWISEEKEDLSEKEGVRASVSENTLTLEKIVSGGAETDLLFGVVRLPVIFTRCEKEVPVFPHELEGEHDLSDRTMAETFVYSRPDYDSLNAKTDSLIARVKAGTEAPEALKKDYDALEDDLNHSYTMNSLVNIRQAEDVGSEYWADESLWLSEQSSALFVKLVKLDVAAYESDKYRDALLEDMTEEDIRYLEIMKKLADDEYVRLTTEDADLQNQYLAAEVNVTVNVNGKDLTYDQLVEQGLDGQYGDAWQDAYVKCVGEILIKMIAVRNKIAKKAGYANYADYAYEIEYERGYTPADAEKFSQAVTTYMPYYASSMPYNFSYAEAEFINNNYYSMKGYDFAAYLDTYRKYLKSIDPAMEVNFNEFLTESRYSVGDDAKRQEGAFTTYLYDYEMPFICMYVYGGPYDTTTLMHEFGHYNAFVKHGEDLGSDIDICELHSQMNEILFLPTWNELLGESKASAIKKFEIFSMANTVLSGCQEDEFQRIIYSEADKYQTVEDLNALYAMLSQKYFGDNDGTGWANIHHTFEVPFYYISYAVSAIPAMELFALSQKDYAKAVETYNKLVSAGTEYTFPELMDYTGLHSPFTEDGIKAVTESLADAFKS